MGIWLKRILCAAIPSLCLASTPITAKKDSTALFELWEGIHQPLAAPAQPIGTYAAGCLAGALQIDGDGAGYAIMRPSRHRVYGHPEMNAYIQALSETLRAQHLPLLLVGDIGPPRGGPMRSGHNSHQIGLDADFWLRMSRARPTAPERESWSAPSFVSHRKKLNRSWGQTQTKLVAAAADSSTVSRVFVSPPIKRYFCAHMPSAPWLYKLRAWWGHEEHIHVRLNCPADSATCEPQAALNPADNGCGTELDWWFSKEADDQWAAMVKNPKPREFPDLPALCDQMVKSNN